MIKSIRDNFLFIIICLLWYYIGKSNQTFGVILVSLSYLLFIARGMYQEQLLGLIYLIILSDNYFIYFAQSVKPIVLILISLNVFLNKKIGFNAPFHKPFIPFFVIAFIVLFFSPDIAYSFNKFSSYLLLFIAIPSFTIFLYFEYKEVFLKNFIYLIIIILAVGILSKYTNPKYAIIAGERFRGVFGNPNGLSIFCVLAFISFEVIRKHLKCTFSVIEIALFYILIALSVLWAGSRNALMSIFIFLVFIRANKLSPFISFILLVSIVLFYEFIIDAGVSFLVDLGFKEQLRLEGSQGIEAASGRIVAWTFAWSEIQKNFFFGLGWAYDELLFFDPKVQAKLNMLNHEGGIHNSYLAIWMNEGLVGVLLFLIAMIGSFFKAAKNSVYALPIMYSCFFMANYEAWMAASLNPFTIQMIMMLSLILFIPVEEIKNNLIADNQQIKSNEIIVA